ncbi:MAG: hypothetical protein ACRYFR_11645 [Janthinobacterium lividum]
MSVTRLKRKHRKNIARANNKQHIIKNLLRTPVLKNVDLDELKARFTTPEGAAPAAKAEAPAAPVAKAEAPAAPVAKEEAPAAKAEAPAAQEASFFDKAKQAVSGAVEAVSHSEVLDKAKHAVSDAVDAVSHSEVVEKAKEVAGNVVDTVKHAVGADAPAEADQAPKAPAADKTAENAADFDDAEAVTKPVNDDGQEGEHPKPEIAL